jgi:tetratricopeptide (TPR) repeat protein
MIAFCGERGLSTSLSWAGMGRAAALFDLGRWDEVLATEAESEEWDRAHGVSHFGTMVRMLAGWIAIRRGDLAGAAERTHDLLPRVQRLGYAEYEAPAYAMLAELALARGRHDEARALLENFARTSASDRLYRTTMLPVVVRIQVRLGDLDPVRRLLAEPAPRPSRRERLSLDSARAVLAEAEGDLPKAADAYREAADGWRRYGMPLELGRLLLGLARCERGLRHPDEAAAAAREAADVLGALEATPLVAEATALLDALETGSP